MGRWLFLQALLAAAGSAQQAGPLFECGFDTQEEVAAWRTFRETDALQWLTRAGHEQDVKGGDGSLCLSFTPGKGTFPAIFRDLELTEPIGALDLWVKVDRTTQVMVSLVERAQDENGTPRRGEAFSVQFHAGGGKWTRATIPLSDFVRDPSSPSGDLRLDAASVGGIAILDALAVFAPDEEASKRFLGDHTGPQRLVLDEFRVLGADTAFAPPSPGIVDCFDRNYLAWVPLHGVEIERTPMPGATSGYGLKARYARAAGVLPAVVLPLNNVSLSGSELGLRVRASGSLRLQVSLEDSDGAKWNASADLSGGDAQTLWLPLSRFAASEDSKFRERPASFERLKLISILDAGESPGAAWFQISDIRVK